MEKKSRFLVENVEYCAEPLLEVLLRSKSSSARVQRSETAELQKLSDIIERGAAKTCNTTSLRLICERCVNPSRMWLHHTCRAVKPAGTDANGYFTGRSKARKGAHTISKPMLRKHCSPFSAGAVCSTGMPCYGAGEQRSTQQKEKLLSRFLQRPYLSGVRPNAEPKSTAHRKSPGIRMTRNCGVQPATIMSKHAIRSQQSSQIESQSPRSGTRRTASRNRQEHSSKDGRKLCRNDVRSKGVCKTTAQHKFSVEKNSPGLLWCEPVPADNGAVSVKNDVQLFPQKREISYSGCLFRTRLVAKPFAAGSKSREDDTRPRKAVQMVGSDDGERMAAGGRALSLLRHTWSAGETCQLCFSSTDVQANAYRSPSRRQTLGDKPSRCEYDWQRSAEADSEADNATRTRHHAICRRSVVDVQTHGSTVYGIDFHDKGRGRASHKLRRPKQKEKPYNESLIKDDISVQKTRALSVSVAPSMDQGILTLPTKRRSRTPPSKREQLTGGEKAHFFRETSIFNPIFSAVTRSHRITQQETSNIQGSASDTLFDPRMYGKDSGHKNFQHCPQKQAKAVVESCAAVEFYVEEGKRPVAAPCDRDKSALFPDSGFSTSFGREVRKSTGEDVALISMAKYSGVQESRSAAASLVSTRSYPSASWEKVAGKQRSDSPLLYMSSTAAADFFAVYHSTRNNIPLRCICERVEKFLDSVECFLQESDPHIRRDRLRGIHAAFVSAEVM